MEISDSAVQQAYEQDQVISEPYLDANESDKLSLKDKIMSFFTVRNIKIAIIITLFLVCGTASVILSKTAYQLKAEGSIEGEEHYFTKPLFFNWSMFLGMSICLVIYFVRYLILPRVSKRFTSNKEKMTWKGYLLILMPSCCDFCATYLMNFGLIVVPSSIFQMMRGSIIVFTAFFSVCYRKAKIRIYEIIGVAIIVFALAMLGTVTFFPDYDDGTADSSSSSGSGESSAWYLVLVGILLILLAQLLQAFQTILEEQFLHDIKAPVEFVGLFFIV